MASLFNTGTPQDITAVLGDRDARVLVQLELLHQSPDRTLVVVKLNVPGPIKNNDGLKRLFDIGLKRLTQALPTLESITTWNGAGGNTAFLWATGSQEKVKQSAVAFEDEDNLGRLFDVDVLSGLAATALSRTALGLPVRRCFVCNLPAKECARSRRHDVPTLQVRFDALAAAALKEQADV